MVSLGTCNATNGSFFSERRVEDVIRRIDVTVSIRHSWHLVAKIQYVVVSKGN